ncbi:unnamed protein product [Amoebophrya sp. A120]|nr:unnamed protein product [Amoebophrya sp. A120]|eukprot:GSA120T00014720001.1
MVNEDFYIKVKSSPRPPYRTSCKEKTLTRLVGLAAAWFATCRPRRSISIMSRSTRCR